jgi:predicted Zn-dependent peptidase
MQLRALHTSMPIPFQNVLKTPRVASIRWSTVFLPLLGLIFVLTMSSTELLRADVSQSQEALSTLRKKVKSYVLSNGIRVVFYKRDVAAPTFSGVVSVRVGGVDEPLGRTGISHLFEHMAFKGTSTIGTKNFQLERPLLEEEARLKTKLTRTPSDEKRLKEVEAQLENLWNGEAFTSLLEEQGAVGINATTSKELTTYFESMPKNRFEFWAWLESQRITDPVFRQFFKERDVVMEERRMRFEDNPEGQLYEKLLHTAFSEHPYRNPVIGYKQDIKVLKPEYLTKLHNQYYVGKNIAIGIVGDIDPEKGIQIIRQYFENIPQGVEPPRTKQVEPVQTDERSVRLHLDKEPLLVLSYHKPVYPHKDDAPITLLGEILSGGNTSILYERLVKQKRLVSDISYSEGPGLAYPNLFSFTITPLFPNSADRILKVLDQELDVFLRTILTEDRLEIAKRSLAMDNLKGLESNLSMAEGFAQSVLLHGRWDASIDWYEEMLRVTADDVMRVARTYMVPTNRTIGMIEKNGQATGK